MNTLFRFTPLNMTPLKTTGGFAPHLARGLLAMALTLGLAPAMAQTGPATTIAAADAPEPIEGNSNLDAALFYQLLLGELNLLDGEVSTGYAYIYGAARNNNDPLLYRRAVDAALQARSGELALQAAKGWSKAFPEASEPDRITLQILLAMNRPNETGAVLRTLLNRSTGEQRSDIITAIPQTYARVPDKALALKVVKEALAPELKRPEQASAAWTSIGRMQLTASQASNALSSANKAHEADPNSASPAFLALELMEQGHIMAESIVRSHLKARPLTATNSTNVAVSYARILLDLHRNAEAASLLQELTRAQPDLPEPWLLQASLQIQSNAIDDATVSLKRFMELVRQSNDERSQRGLTQAYLLMAQLAERQKDYEAANAWIDRIENADDIMAVQMRRASLLARQGKMGEARALLRNHPTRRPEDTRQKWVAEAQLLRDFNLWQEAYGVYEDAAKNFPEDLELVYDQAMMAEKANRLEDMERLLRQIMASKPDHYHAYNALGYSLADRGMRLDEAKQLIEKAVSLQPNDAYIRDSLGWVEFRSGNVTKALEILRSAYSKRPDPEIAAHLGEVLWTLGHQEEARKIWSEGLVLSSDNETLHTTLKRFGVKP